MDGPGYLITMLEGMVVDASTAAWRETWMRTVRRWQGWGCNWRGFPSSSTGTHFGRPQSLDALCHSDGRVCS